MQRSNSRLAIMSKSTLLPPFDPNDRELTVCDLQVPPSSCGNVISNPCVAMSSKMSHECIMCPLAGCVFILVLNLICGWGGPNCHRQPFGLVITAAGRYVSSETYRTVYYIEYISTISNHAIDFTNWCCVIRLAYWSHYWLWLESYLMQSIMYDYLMQQIMWRLPTIVSRENACTVSLQ